MYYNIRIAPVCGLSDWEMYVLKAQMGLYNHDKIGQCVNYVQVCFKDKKPSRYSFCRNNSKTLELIIIINIC